MHKTRKNKTSLLNPNKVVTRTYRISFEAIVALEDLTIRLSEQSNMQLSLGKVLGLIIAYTKDITIQELLAQKKKD